MKIAAHRGVSSLAPENTLAAFSKAPELGCEWIELDVQLTQDDVPVVIHDKTVDRCTNDTGIVSEMTLESLKSLDAGSWFNESYSDERIPTLEEVLLLAKEINLKVNIEIKLYPGDDIELLCEKINQVINDLDIQKNQLLFSCFNVEALRYMHSHQPLIRRGQLWEKIPNDGALFLTEIAAFSVHCNYLHLNEKQAKKIKAAGYELYCYTANVPEQVKSHWDWGVDMMMTDVPQAYFNDK